MNYTLHQLQVFLKVAELKSITKAAEELHLTQPAVSIQLKKFQDQFTLPLTEVIGRQLYITDFGAEIAEAAQSIAMQIEAINYKTHQYEGRIAGKLKISIVSTGKYLMPYFLSQFMRDHPGVDLKMDVTNKSTVIKHLENNETDFALVSVIPDHLKINALPIMKNRLHMVAGRTYQKLLDLPINGTIDKVPFVYREQGSATRAAMERYIDEHDLNSPKKIELTSNEAVKQAVIAGIGVSILPLIGLKSSLQNGDIKIVPRKGLPITTQWNLIWLKSKKLSTTAKAFVTYMDETKDIIIRKQFDWLDRYGVEMADAAV